jgi:hypothetical protein
MHCGVAACLNISFQAALATSESFKRYFVDEKAHGNSQLLDKNVHDYTTVKRAFGI